MSKPEIGISFVSKVQTEYAASLDRITQGECEAMEMPASSCKVLVETLGAGVAGRITPQETFDLFDAGFSQKFIKALIGEDGKSALQARVRWLGDHLNTRWWRHDFNLETRVGMAEELVSAGKESEPILENLMEILMDEQSDKNLCIAAAQTMLVLGAAGLESLRKELKSPQSNRRLQAIKVVYLFESKAEAAIPDLIHILKTDEMATVRREAALTLAKLQSPQVISALIQAIEDTDVGVKYLVVNALNEIWPGVANTVTQQQKADALEKLQSMQKKCLHPETCEKAKVIMSQIVSVAPLSLLKQD